MTHIWTWALTSIYKSCAVYVADYNVFSVWYGLDVFVRILFNNIMVVQSMVVLFAFTNSQTCSEIAQFEPHLKRHQVRLEKERSTNEPKLTREKKVNAVKGIYGKTLHEWKLSIFGFFFSVTMFFYRQFSFFFIIILKGRGNSAMKHNGYSLFRE